MFSKIYEQHRTLVERGVARYLSRAPDLAPHRDDFHQVALLELWSLSQRFDPQSEEFRRWAHRRIQWRLKDYGRTHAAVVYVPKNVPRPKNAPISYGVERCLATAAPVWGAPDVAVREEVADEQALVLEARAMQRSGMRIRPIAEKLGVCPRFLRRLFRENRSSKGDQKKKTEGYAVL